MLKILITTVVYNERGVGSEPNLIGNVRTDVVDIGSALSRQDAERLVNSFDTHIRLPGSDTWVSQTAVKLW